MAKKKTDDQWWDALGALKGGSAKEAYALRQRVLAERKKLPDDFGQSLIMVAGAEQDAYLDLVEAG